MTVAGFWPELVGTVLAHGPDLLPLVSPVKSLVAAPLRAIVPFEPVHRRRAFLAFEPTPVLAGGRTPVTRLARVVAFPARWAGSIDSFRRDARFGARLAPSTFSALLS
ncbi:MAG: hypothetical protein H0U40_00380 [Chloroflexia bacterium]|nr:hypothetical protein [Chloroflexia bacterium]